MQRQQPQVDPKQAGLIRFWRAGQALALRHRQTERTVIDGQFDGFIERGMEVGAISVMTPDKNDAWLSIRKEQRELARRRRVEYEQQVKAKRDADELRSILRGERRAARV
jgi:hypothetical protein